MTVRGPIALLALVLAACAPAARPAATPVPAPESPPPATPAAPAPAPATPLLEAPEDWQLRDLEADRLPGTGVNRAYQELLADIAPTRTVVVAVIDSGVDTAHVDLRANLWRNEREVPGNGIDDDGNGYVDDVHGWNFIGGEDGEQVRYDTFEVTRLHVACESEAPAEAERRAECAEIAADFENRRREAEETLQQIGLIKANLDIVLPMLRAAIGTDSLTVANVTELRSSRSDVMQARSYYLTLMGAGITPEAVEEAETAYGTQLEYNLNPAFDPRAIVGDDYSDPDERVYGNSEMMGPDAKHGTHVAGIIAAIRDNGIGVDGIAPDVRIMVLRAVPDGDERDKDVGNAIRYAVDNGAHIINMSFGKAWSPAKEVVDAAVRHADENGVLLIHAAGNDGEDLASSANYPNRRYLEGGEARNWIEVGASSWKPADSLVAPFSNYGRAEVDLFAPGVDILSTVPGGGIQRQNGTSMAAPVVTGIAALLMAYFPELGAADVRRILLETATSHADRPVLRPGTPGGETVPFGQLSVTGGVVNAYEAVRRAAQTRVRT